MRPRHLLVFFIRISALALLGLGASAFAQADPPGRIGRINSSEGTVSFAPAGDDEFTDADLNRPLSPGDKLWTDKGVRADLQVGSAAVRMDGRTHLTVLALDDQSTQLSVTQGTVFVRVRALPEGENFEVDTPNLAWRASYPGDYRVDVDGQRGTTRVTIHSGTGAVYGEKGEALPMGGGQQIIFKGRALAQVDSHEQPPEDNFDRWATERNRREDQSPAARYVPREVVGYQLLDSTGQWQQDANYGVVWYPQSVKADWAPYRNGRWEWIAPWGWTWIDAAPWAFVTSHYGRWALVNDKWGWVPGRMGLRPIYAPALVAFVGNGNAPLSIGGKQAVAWFPLAPGEAWQPTYNATPLYISTVNMNMPPVQQGGSYAYQRKPEALTAIAMDDFQRGKAAKGSWLRVASSVLTTAQVVSPPAMPAYAKTMMARLPAPKMDVKPAVNKGPTAAQQLEAQRQADAAKAQTEAQKQADEARKVAEAQKQAQAQKLADAQAQRERERLAREEQKQQRDQAEKAEQAAKIEQARAEQTRRAEKSKATEQQRAVAEQQQRVTEQKLARQHAAEQARVVQEQRAAEQAKVAEAAKKREQREAVAKRAEQTKREQVAKREQAKREQVAALLHEREARRDLQARRAQEAKRLVAAKKDEEARRIAHAQEVERSRRAAEREAQVLQAQRTARDEQIRRVSEEKEKQRAQQEAWARQQQALAEQWKRDQQAFEEQQRQKAQQRQRPDLRKSQPAAEPEVWQRGIPILNPGRTS